jgi:hypothetical protein
MNEEIKEELSELDRGIIRFYEVRRRMYKNRPEPRLRLFFGDNYIQVEDEIK